MESEKNISEHTVANAFKANWPNLTVVVLLFGGSLIAGYLRPDFVPAWMLESLQKAQDEFNKDPGNAAFAEFWTLLLYVYFGFIMGIAAGILPVYIILSTGLNVGAMAAGPNSGGFISALGVPDILEMIALCIAMAWGVRLGFSWIEKPRLPNLKKAFTDGHIMFRTFVLPLLVAAFLWRFVEIALGK